MAMIHTAYGPGEVVAQETVRGRTQYQVAGNGFKVWLDEVEVNKRTASDPRDRAHNHTYNESRDRGWDEHGQQDLDDWHPSDAYDLEHRGPEDIYSPHHQAASFDFEPTDHVWDNHTTLPYTWQPQYPVDMFRDEQTMSPDHQIDIKKRMHPSDSRSGEGREDTHEYPGPNPDLFAEKEGRLGWTFHDEDPEDEEDRWHQYNTHAVDVPHVSEHEASRPAGLSDKYIEIHEAADHFNDPVVRFRDDPVREIHRHGSIDISAGLDHETGEWMTLVEADKSIRTAAWADVRQKALRLRREGRVAVQDMDHNRIYANVKGDHGEYDVMIHKGGSMGGIGGGQSITNWRCSCEWGKWAFKRQQTYIGRLCSHGYATYLTQQAAYLKDNPHHFKKKRRTASKTAAGVDAFKSWADKENGGHIDMDAADNYLSTLDEPASKEDAKKILDYVQTHHSEHPERDYDVKGYSYDEDGPLQHQPGKLTPHTYVVPEGEGSKFTDLGDDRKTTGPDQIMARRTAKESFEHHPDFAWHVDDKDDFPEQGIVHFSSLTFTADENLLDKLRTLSEDTYQPGDMQSRNREISEVVKELRERGYDADQFVASLRRHGAGDMDAEDMLQPDNKLEPGGEHGAFIPSMYGQETGAGVGDNPPNALDFGNQIDEGAGHGGSGHLLPGETNPLGAPSSGGTAPAAGPPAAGGGHSAPSTPGGGAGPAPMAGGAAGSSLAPAGGAAGGGGKGWFGPGSGGAAGGGGGHIGPGEYAVQSGDTLSGIADRAGDAGGYQDLVKNNPGSIGNSGTNLQSNPNLIHPGDQIKIPGAPAPAAGTDNGPHGAPGSAKNPTNAIPGPGISTTLPGAPAGKAAAQRFAELYFFADDEGDSSSDDKKTKTTVGPDGSVSMPDTGPGNHPWQNQGPEYNKSISGPGATGPGAQPINQPRPSTNAQGMPMPTAPLHTPENNAPNPDASENAAATPGVKPVGPAAPANSPGNAAPGSEHQKDNESASPGAGGMGLENAMSMAAPLIGDIAGPLASGIGGLAGGLGGALGSGLSGLTKLLSREERFAAQYMTGDSDFLGQGGPDWMDFPFAGSGPDRQDWSTTSEDYVNEHERPKRQETWRTDNDGDIVKYTERLPKQSARQVRRHADMLSGDAGFGGGPGPEVGGATLSPSGSGQGTGGSFSEPATPGPTMGTLTNTARLSESSQRFWADAVDKSDQGYYNPRNPHPHAYDKGDDGTGDDGQHGQGGRGGAGHGMYGDMAGEAGEAGEAAEGAGALGEAAELAPLLLASRGDDGSDVVRMFQASGGGCLGGDAGSGGGQYSDEAIAANAQKMLRTAGRNFTPAEQRELEDEFHPRGARNLGDLDLTGTHYVD